jgi:hypothetical protein
MPKHVAFKIKNCITKTPVILILLLLDGKTTHYLDLGIIFTNRIFSAPSYTVNWPSLSKPYFSTTSHIWHNFRGEEVTELKMRVLNFSVTLSQIFLIPRRTQ